MLLLLKVARSHVWLRWLQGGFDERALLHYADTAGGDTPGGNHSILVQKQQGIEGKSLSKEEEGENAKKRQIR